MLWFVLFRVVLSLRLLFSATNRLFVNRIHSIMDTPSTSAQPPEDTPPPAPFTPEQLQWIDRLIANRHAQSTGTEASGFPQPPPASSAILSTPASQPGALGLLSGITCPSFMPTFTPTSGNLDVLATAALSQLPMGQPNGSVAPIPSTGVGAVGVTSIPGFTAIPAKLIRRIWALEYVEMWELLPETWRQDAAQVECCHAKRPKRGLITDIALWSECFAALAAALATRYPQKAPQFLAYLRTIVRASRNFEGTAWASYDAAYRRQAANSRSLDWATSDPALYNEAFTGRAKAIPRCQFCLSDTHQSRDCMFAPEDQKRYGQPSAPWRGASSVPVAQICRLFNRPGGSQCRFKLCRYAHLCARCNRPHPMSECDRRQAARPPRSPSPSAKARGA